MYSKIEVNILPVFNIFIYACLKTKQNLFRYQNSVSYHKFYKLAILLLLDTIKL